MKSIYHTIFLLMLIVSTAISEPRIRINEGSITSLEDSAGEVTISKRYTGGKLPVLGEGVYRYTVQFAKNDSICHPTLFFGAMYYPCVIAHNGHTIYRWGSLDGKGGMVNYRSNSILLTTEELKDSNTLTIDFWTDGLVMGLPNLWIGSNEDVTVQAEYFNAVNVTGTRIGVALSFIAFLCSMLAFFIVKGNRSSIFRYSMFALMTALAFHMFLFNGSTIDHVFQSKVFRSAALFMGVTLFYTISDILGQFRNRRLQTLIFLLHLPAIYLIWRAGSKYEIEGILRIAIPVLTAPMILLSIITCIKSISSKNTIENWLVFANVVVIVCATYNDLSSLGRKTLPTIWMIPYAYILMTFTTIGVIVLRQFKISIEHQKNRIELEILYRKLELANRDAQNSRELAIQESNARESFLKTIAHELRTPLTGLLGGVNILATDAGMPNHLKKSVFYMKNSFHRLFLTVNNLFDFIEIKRGDVAILKHPFSVHEVIEPILAYYKEVAQLKGISFILLSKKGIPNDLYGDSEHLLQVIDNLIGNAIKFTKVGGVSCEIDYSYNTLSIIVKDTGIGISQEKQMAMFASFSRGEDFAFAQKYEGVGLGLAIVDALVIAMKGKLEFTSTPEKGTQFSVSIPMIPANSRRTSFVSRKKILVVEDNVINSIMVVKQLESAKFYVDPVFNGQEALERCRTQHYDAIIMDIQMPIMDGMEATVEIRKLNERVPIIALTANGDRLQCMRVGMNEFLLKPISTDKLISVVSNIIFDSEKGG